MWNYDDKISRLVDIILTLTVRPWGYFIVHKKRDISVSTVILNMNIFLNSIAVCGAV